MGQKGGGYDTMGNGASPYTKIANRDDTGVWRELIFSARRKDFRIDTFRSGGKGGQHQNKTDSGVRITHFDTGLSAESRSSRSQPKNRKTAFRKLAKLLVKHVLKQEQREKVISNEVIRTYNAVDNRVKDHASGLQMSWKEVVEKPNLEPMIEARARARSE